MAKISNEHVVLGEDKCPHCGYGVDSASSVSRFEEGVEKPKPGDMSICVMCGGLLRFGDDMALRKFTEEDWKDFTCDQRVDVERVQRAARDMMKKMRGKQSWTTDDRVH